jgi:hypothetical protein
VKRYESGNLAAASFACLTEADLQVSSGVVEVGPGGHCVGVGLGRLTLAEWTVCGADRHATLCIGLICSDIYITSPQIVGACALAEVYFLKAAFL